MLDKETTDYLDKLLEKHAKREIVTSLFTRMRAELITVDQFSEACEYLEKEKEKHENN